MKESYFKWLLWDSRRACGQAHAHSRRLLIGGGDAATLAGFHQPDLNAFTAQHIRDILAMRSETTDDDVGPEPVHR